MPEIKNTFTSGKMNKDLDERLVPNGQYVDALNVDVASSASDNVGTIHNSFGNVRKDTMHDIGGKCIGSMVNKESQTIIWFIAGTNVDVISEYNPTTDISTPILISPKEDAPGAFLNFNAERIITAINVIDGYLYWTDNYSEPKRINIKRGKAGRYTSSSSVSDLWTTTTKLKIKDGTFDGNVLEKHLTVIRPYPVSAPTLSLSNSLREGSGNATVRIPNNTSTMPSDVNGGNNDKTCNIYGRASGNVVQYYKNLTFKSSTSATSVGDKEISVNSSASGFIEKNWQSVVPGYYLYTKGAGSEEKYYKITAVNYAGYSFTVNPYDGVSSIIGVRDIINANSDLSILTFQEVYNNHSFFNYKDSTGEVIIKPLGISANDSNNLKDGGLLNNGTGKDITPTAVSSANGFAPVASKPNQATLTSTGTTSIVNSSAIVNTFLIGHVYELNMIVSNHSGGYCGFFEDAALGVSSAAINQNGTISYKFTAKTTGSLRLFRQLNVAADISFSIKCLSGPREVKIQELIFEGQPDYKVGDIVNLSLKNPLADNAGESTELEFRVKILEENLDNIENVSGYGGTGSNGARKVFNCEIISLDNSISLLTNAQANGPWICKRQKPNSIYQQTFPRFAYRWKYIDNEFSVMSSFTEVAFLPIDEEYEYDSESGFNKVMENDVRRIVLSGFEKTPKDVVGLDILYKESNSTSIYIVESLKYEELRSLSDYVIDSEIVKGVLPSNQLLRPYDNVPTKAKAQEITGNRLLYGHYTQQRNVDEKLKVISSVDKKNILDFKANKSIKSIRDYQLGVSVLDVYGRQTPIFSSNEGIVKLTQEDSDNATSFLGKVISKAPSWATHYKYFVKDNSTEYYNLAMDRFYSAEADEHVWLSFPSCDVNKVSEDDFIILKKEHDSSITISENKTVKYKVLAKESSAPDFIKIKKESLGRSSTGINFATNNGVTSGYPLKGLISFTLRSSSISGFEQIFEEAEGRVKQIKKFIKVGSIKSGVTTDFYELDTVQWSVTDTKAGEVYYTFKLKVPFGKDISLTGSSPGSSTRGLFVEFYEEKESTDLTEFQGRFFIKVLRDNILNDFVLSSKAVDNYIVLNSQALYWAHTYAVGAIRTIPDGGNPVFAEIVPNVIKVGSAYTGTENIPSDKFNSFYLKDQSTFKYLTDKLLDNNWGDDGFGSEYNNSNGIVTYNAGGVVNSSRVLKGTMDNQSYWMGSGIKSTWAIDSSWSWVNPDQKFRLHNYGNSNYLNGFNKEMGEGFVTGNKFAEFKVFGLGRNQESNFAHLDNNAASFPGGYTFPPKNKDIENYDLYKQLSTVGTKFRFSKDPGQLVDGVYNGDSTVYTIVDKEVIEIKNYTTKWNAGEATGFDNPANKGVRIHVKLDKAITWSPCDESSKDSDDNSANINYLNGNTGRRNISNTSTIEILQLDPSKNSFSTNDPAIFETEPKERADLDLYYETSTTEMVLKDGMSISTSYINPATSVSALKPNAIINFIRGWKTGAFQISQTQMTCDIPAGETVTISKKDTAGNVVYSQDYVFDFILSSVANNSTKNNGVWTNGASGTVSQIINTPKTKINWFNCFSFGNGVESNRVRDDFNAPTIDKGVKVSVVLDNEYKEEVKTNSIIYSGLYNKSSSLNNLNQFIQAEKITKDLNPEYGTIQKLFTRNTNVLALCENKILKILANKDALFNADGNTNIVATNKVLGQTVPFLGEFGISRNPESFANYGYRIYFSDKDRNAVIRLSGDGLTDISKTGMTTFFRSNLKQAGNIIGTYDEDKQNYNITLNDKTVSFSEEVKGWTSLKSFIPESGVSLDSGYYTFFNKFLWKHGENELRNNFYGVQATKGSNITFVFNQESSTVKTFKTLSYEGSKDWFANSIQTDLQSGKINSFVDKEGLWFNYIKGVSTNLQNLDLKELVVQGLGALSSISLGGYAYFLQITSTAKVAAPQEYWTVNTSVSNSLNSIKTITANKESDTAISSFTMVFYVHSKLVDGKQWSVKASNFTATTSSLNPSSPIVVSTPVLADLGTVGSFNNVVSITTTLTGTMPELVNVTFDVNVGGYAELIQILNPY